MIFPHNIKLDVCNRVGSSWVDLAEVLEIGAHERSRFPLGREAYAIWDWLDERDRS